MADESGHDHVQGGPPKAMPSEVDEPEHDGARIHEHLGDNVPGHEHKNLHPEDEEQLKSVREPDQVTGEIVREAPSVDLTASAEPELGETEEDRPDDLI